MADLAALVRKVVRACQICQAVQLPTSASPAVFEPLPIPQTIFSSISLDFLELPGKKTIDNEEKLVNG